MIEVSNVTHRFGRRKVLDAVSLKVEPGAVVGLVGPNGAGKSTLLRLIATQLRPMAGKISVGGTDVREDAPAVRRLVGYLPERGSVYPDLLSWEYLDLFGEIAGLDIDLRRQRVEAALSLAGLQGRWEQPCGELSKGLQQRLAFQSILLHGPRALLLDEPTDGLDPQTRDQVCLQIKALAEKGCAVLVSSHVLEELKRVAHRALALNEGRLTELKSSGRGRWALRFRGDSAVARLVAMGVASVVEASVIGDSLAGGGTMMVELGDGVADPAEVTTALVQAGIPVVEITEKKASLRDLYNQTLQEGEA